MQEMTPQCQARGDLQCPGWRCLRVRRRSSLDSGRPRKMCVSLAFVTGEVLRIVPG
jgi:hypothetical protein